MVLTGAATYITGWTYARYIYIIGATFFALAQINSPYRGDNKNIKRLHRQQIIGALLLVMAGVLMFTLRNNEWILCLAVAAFIQLYTVFRIGQEEKKE